MGQYHIPVLLQAVCNWLSIRPGGKYIDATVGGGGHAAEIIRRGGRVLGLDQDPDAISACLATHSSHVRGQRLFLVRTNFSHLVEVARQMGWTSVDGILFDLGVSWHQISDPGRGFSFRQTGPLDMRMDPSLAVTAADLVNSLSVSQLGSILGQFGEVARPDSLARRIAASRPLTTTTQLA